MARRADIERIVAQYRRRLGALEADYDRTVGPAHARAAAAIRDELGRFLRAVDRAGIPDVVTRKWVTDQVGYRQLVAVAESQLDAVTEQAVRAIQWRIADAANLGQPAANALTAATIGPAAQGLPVGVFGQVNIGAITQLVGQLQASSLLAALPGLTAKAVEGMTSELVRGLANGQHSRTIARSIARETGMPAVRARVIARTEIHRAYREANRAAYQANSVTKQWRWMASLGPRTCSACFAMHGTLHDLDEPLQSHPQCRCAMAPVVDTSQLRAFGIDAPDVDWPTGEQVFAKLDADTQRGILGPRYPAYAEGKITLADTIRTRQSREWGTTRSVASVDETLRNAS